MNRKNVKRNKSILKWIFDPLLETSKYSAPDYAFLIGVSFITAIGLLMLSSATSIIAFEQFGNSYGFVKQQINHGILPGIILFFVTSRIHFSTYRRFAPFLFFGMLILLILPFIPGIGTSYNSVSSWVSIGGVTFQPSELAKLAFVLWLASWLSLKNNTIKSFTKTTLPFIIILGVVSTLLMLQPDIGTMAIFVSVSITMLIIANANMFHVVGLMLFGVAAVLPIILSAPYRLQRILTFWNPESDIQGSGYQIYQALLAIGSGSWFGLGVGQSRQKFNYLPELSSDSVFAIIGEEMGFLVSALLIALFAFIFVRALKIAKNAPNTYAALIVIGIIFVISYQVLINIGSMLGLLPLTGIPLPFISLGGTNIAMLFASVGIISQISRHSHKNG